MKKEYKKPTVRVFKIHQRQHLLAGSGGVRSVSGINGDFQVSDQEGNGSDAW